MNGGYCMHCLERIDGENTCCKHCGNPALGETPVHHIKPGTILKDKYLIGKALGEGGFGITYIGRDMTLDMKVAVKEFYPNGYSHRNHNYTNEITPTQSNAGDNFEKDMQRFLNEARTLAKFSNEEGIVCVRDFFRANNTAYIVMEYLDGMTLKKYLQENGPIPANRLFPLMEPVIRSLELIHNEGVIHRDISPDNIMILKSGRLKLLDFGAARHMNTEKSLSVMLKHGYAPEEQYRSKGNQGPWTDVYAMCATIYKCLTGITPMESLERVYEDELQPPSRLGVAISAIQEAVLMRGLSIRIGDRIQNMAELRASLGTHETEESIQSIVLHKQDQTDAIKTIYQPKHNKEDALVQSDELQTVYQPPEDACADVLQKESDRINPVLDHAVKKELKPKKANMSLVIAVVAMLIIALVLLPIVIGSGSDPVQESFMDSIPTERVMASDSSTVLRWAEVSGSVLDINVQDEILNEEYKTFVVTCEVTVLESDKEKVYTAVLVYEYEDEGWVLSSLSKIKE